MDTPMLIQKTADFVRAEFQDDSTGHDWWHIERVWKMALRLCEDERADALVVQLAALLHDLDDWKFYPESDGTPSRARAWLTSCNVDPDIVNNVCQIIQQVSFKGAGVNDDMKSIEGFIVQDADRLDAIGAIGIARAFAYGGAMNRPLHDPESPARMHASFDEYRGNKSSTINHFYEKLLLLKDRMHTAAAKKIAARRHEVMLQFLGEFKKEWDGE